MALKHVLHELLGLFTPSRCGRNRRPARRARSRPLTLEQLETRLTPATHVWSGAVSDLWSVAGNWSSGGSPVGDLSPDLVFPASGVTRFTSKDDLALDTVIHSIQFNDRGYDLTATAGNRIKLGTDITANNTSGVNAIEIDISLTAADHTFKVAGDGGLDVIKGVFGGVAGSTLFKDGTGELVFSHDNDTYSNNTRVMQGTFSALGDGSAGDFLVSRMTVDAGATLVVSNSSVGSLAGAGSVVTTGPGGGLAFGYDNTSTTFSGVISGPGGIDKHGSGTQTLGGQNTYTGGVTNINGGTLLLATDNALPSTADVNLTPGVGTTLGLGANHILTIAALRGGDSTNNVKLGTGTLTIQDNEPSPNSFNGIISGTGSLVKTGSGTQLLGGNNTYTGSTTINGGTLEIDGSQSQSAVTVAAGAVLSGTGTVGSVTVLGTLRPGSLANLTGTLFVAGNVTFSGPSAIFAVELDGTGAGQYSQLNASGTVDLGTSTRLTVTFGYTPVSGDTFSSVITSASLVDTPFSSVPPGIQDSYSATDVDLSIL
jgi:autotransporter-associated beta strand protein